MKISLILYLTTILLLTCVNASGISEKVDVGPFVVEFAINTSIEPVINTIGPANLKGFSEYQLQIRVASKNQKSINVTIDDYQNNTDVSESKLISLITDMIQSNSYKINWNKTRIGSIPAIMAQVQDFESFSTYSIAAYSPDGDGKIGRTIVVIKSSLSGDFTDSFLKDLRLRRTQKLAS